MASEGQGTSNASVTENLIPPNVNDDKLIKAELVKDKSPEAIRELLGLEDDLTPEEKEEIKKQNVWCNYD